MNDMLNPDRIKNGGVRRNNLLDVIFDLMQFEKEEIPKPTEEDMSLFRQMHATLYSCQKGVGFGCLRDALKEIKGL